MKNLSNGFLQSIILPAYKLYLRKRLMFESVTYIIIHCKVGVDKAWHSSKWITKILRMFKSARFYSRSSEYIQVDDDERENNGQWKDNDRSVYIERSTFI